jgi:transposase
MWDTHRLQNEVVELWHDLKACARVGAIKNIATRTISRWVRHYKLYGELPIETRKKRIGAGPRPTSRIITRNVKQALFRICRNSPWLYLDEFQQKLLEATGVRVHGSTIWRVLTKECHWSLKVAVCSARERDEVERAEWHVTLSQITQDPLQFVFVDESAKDRNSSRRKRTWQPRGEVQNIPMHFSDRYEFRYTLIGAADMRGFIPEMCELVRRKRYVDDPDPEAGTVDTERFLQWVEHRLCPHLGNFFMGEPRSIVVMDNASTHWSPRIQQLIAATGAILLFQPTYSPDLNPIEYCFNQYKSHLKRNHWQYGYDYILAHFRAMSSVTGENMENYYRHVGGIRNVPDRRGATQRRKKFIVLLHMPLLSSSITTKTS